LDNINKDGTIINDDRYNRLTVKSTDSWHDPNDYTDRGASSIRGVRESATSEKPPLGRNKTQLLSTSGWGESAHRETLDKSNVTTRVTVNSKENSNKNIKYPDRDSNESTESYVSNLREANMMVAGCGNGSLPLTSQSTNKVLKRRKSIDNITLPTTRSRTSREKNVITYEHLKGDKTISSRLGDLEDYYFLKGTTHRDDED